MKKKIGILPRLFIAIAFGAVIGLYAPAWVMRSLNCFRDTFGQFIKFFVPFIIIGLVTPAIADTGRTAGDFDLIATGDLGWIGRDLLLELFDAADIPMPADRLVDCGASLYAREQDAHAGGSGCGCVASVSCGWLIPAY